MATPDIQWKKADKETPIDEALLKDKIKEHLLKNLRKSGLFAEVFDEAFTTRPRSENKPLNSFAYRRHK